MIGSKQQPSGLSLVETMIYIAIISLVVAGLFSFSLTIVANRNKAYAAQEVQSNVRSLLTVISQDIRQADNVISPTEGVAGNSLVLDMGDNPDITFSLTDSVLYRSEGVGDPAAVTSNRVLVSNLSFDNLAGVGERDNIRLTASLDYTGNDSQDFNYSYDLQAAFALKK